MLILSFLHGVVMLIYQVDGLHFANQQNNPCEVE
jgi:hypothetical protein